jgi:hypothetical protein
MFSLVRPPANAKTGSKCDIRKVLRKRRRSSINIGLDIQCSAGKEAGVERSTRKQKTGMPARIKRALFTSSDTTKNKKWDTTKNKKWDSTHDRRSARKVGK